MWFVNAPCTQRAITAAISPNQQHHRCFTASHFVGFVSPTIAQCLSCATWQPSSRETRWEARKLPFQQQISQSHVSLLLKINTSPPQQLDFQLFYLL